MYSLKKKFIWLRWVLVVVHGIFTCGAGDLYLWHAGSVAACELSCGVACGT